MAPRFKRNMYQTYKEVIRTQALICFCDTSKELYKTIFQFRDKLVDKVSQTYSPFTDKIEGKSTPIDSWFRLFRQQDRKKVEDFFNTKRPGILSRILETKKWIEYKTNEKKINQSVLFELGTSHDFPCLDVYSSIHSENELSKLIESVAEELNINMTKNPNLGPAKTIVYSNHTFEL